MEKYEIIMYWSEEDNAFVADVPELPGCMAHGATHELAPRNVKAAIRLWIRTAKEFNDPNRQAALVADITITCLMALCRPIRRKKISSFLQA